MHPKAKENSRLYLDCETPKLFSISCEPEEEEDLVSFPETAVIPLSLPAI